MKSQIEKLAQMSVTALKAKAKSLGGKLVTPDGKAKTKQQLINTIVMKNRLAGRSMGANHTGKAKKATAKKTMAKKPATKPTLGNKEYYDFPLSRAFTVTVLPKTQTQKARVKIYDSEFNDTKIIPYVADGSGGGITAQAYFESLGIKISARAYSKKTVLLLTKNFLIPIKKQ